MTGAGCGGAYADLLIDGDSIAAVLRPGESVAADTKRIDATNRLLIPGMVNAHTHATVALCKGLVDRWSLELLLNGYPWSAGGRTVETKYLSAKIGTIEKVRQGCTRGYDRVARMPIPSVGGVKASADAQADVG